MKIEITPLDAKRLLILLKDSALRDIAIDHFAFDVVAKLIESLEAALKEKSK